MSITFHLFRQKMERFPVFSLQDIRKTFPVFDRKRLVEWQDKGYLHGVTRGFYAWPGQYDNIADRWALACKLYPPAYISLQSALSHYGFIPEGVFSVTAVSTRKTRSFNLGPTGFFFRTIQPGLFWGYTLQKAPNGLPYNIAYPEKVIADTLYFGTEICQVSDFDDLRWNRVEMQGQLNPERLKNYLQAFRGAAFQKRADAFTQWLHA